MLFRSARIVVISFDDNALFLPDLLAGLGRGAACFFRTERAGFSSSAIFVSILARFSRRSVKCDPIKGSFVS